MRSPIVRFVAQKKVPLILIAGLAISMWVGSNVKPTLSVDETLLDVHQDDTGAVYFIQREKRAYLADVVPYAEAKLNPVRLTAPPGIKEELVWRDTPEGDAAYYRLDLRSHFGYWSLLPAVVAIALCWITKEPMTSLLAGVVVGAFLLGRYDITGDVLVTSLSTTAAASVLVLYLWLLGGLLGIWSKTGAAQAFAECMARQPLLRHGIRISGSSLPTLFTLVLTARLS